MLKALFSLFIIFGALSSYAQKVEMEFKIKGLQKDSSVYLGNYLGKSLYYYDTLTVQKGGVVKFKSDSIPSGVYALITTLKPAAKFFTFIVNNEDIKIEADNADLNKSIKVKKSVENTLFFDYINFLNKQSLLKAPMLEARKKEGLSEDEKIKLSKQITKIDEQVIAYQKNLVKEHSEKLVAQIINMSMEPDAAVFPEGGVKDTAMFRYQYYKNHYFDKINLKNDALARTPIFHQRLDNFFMKVAPQDPDSICKEVFKLTDKMNEPGDMFKYTVNHLTYAHVKTKRMGMDKVYINMVKKYYLQGRCPWVKESTLKKMQEDVDRLDKILIGNFAPNIILPDTTQKNFVSLYKDVKAKYTLLYFWDWTCGHCKKETPKLKKFYDSIKANTDFDIEVYAVCTKEDNSGWLSFINKHDLNFINVSDAPDMTEKPEKYGMDIKEINGQKTLVRNDNGLTINYRSTYDVFVTPQLFLLDKDKKILAKQISIEQVGDLIQNIEEREKNKK